MAKDSPKSQLRITAAAMRTLGGTIYSLSKPATHDDVIAYMKSQGHDQQTIDLSTKGYLTSTKRFVSTGQALQIALDAGQIETRQMNGKTITPSSPW